MSNVVYYVRRCLWRSHDNIMFLHATIHNYFLTNITKDVGKLLETSPFHFIDSTMKTVGCTHAQRKQIEDKKCLYDINIISGEA